MKIKRPRGRNCMYAPMANLIDRKSRSVLKESSKSSCHTVPNRVITGTALQKIAGTDTMPWHHRSFLKTNSFISLQGASRTQGVPCIKAKKQSCIYETFEQGAFCDSENSV